MKYRKKPVVIEAKQWVGNHQEMPFPPAPSHLLQQDPKEAERFEKWLRE